MAIIISIQVLLIDEGFRVQDCALNLEQMEVPVCRLFIDIIIHLFIPLLVFVSNISFFLLACLDLCTYQLFPLYYTKDLFIHSFISTIFYYSLTTLVYVLINYASLKQDTEK